MRAFGPPRKRPRYGPPGFGAPRPQRGPQINLADLLGGFGMQGPPPGPHPGFIGGPVRPGRQPFRGPGGPGAGGPVNPGMPPTQAPTSPRHPLLMPEDGNDDDGFGEMENQFGEMDPVLAAILARAFQRFRGWGG